MNLEHVRALVQPPLLSRIFLYLRGRNAEILKRRRCRVARRRLCLALRIGFKLKRGRKRNRDGRGDGGLERNRCRIVCSVASGLCAGRERSRY